MQLWTRMYIGETSRSLDVRISEHKRSVKNMDRKSAIAAHIMENLDHQIQWKDSRIKEFEMNWYKRVKEALWIKISTNCLNTDPGITSMLPGKHCFMMQRKLRLWKGPKASQNTVIWKHSHRMFDSPVFENPDILILTSGHKSDTCPEVITFIRHKYLGNVL